MHECQPKRPVRRFYHGIPRQRQIIVAFIATEELVRHGDNVAADPPLWGDPIVEAELEAVVWRGMPGT